MRSESTNGASASDHDPGSNGTQFFSDSSNLTQVAQTLAAYGGGSVSVDLALDLVLNEVVQQARSATGATGAAVALFRDGDLTCRATAGENSPDLGVRVDATSGLAGACFSTGEIQQCGDTETDSRVNAEACRRLGVRSMLIAPLVDQSGYVGIIQVFSSLPNAFGKREISALQVLAGRIAENTRMAEEGVPIEQANAEPPATTTPAMEIEPAVEQTVEPVGPSADEKKPSVVLNSVLIVLVIATAIALGIVIGWRKAATTTSPAPGKTSVLSGGARSAPAPAAETQTDAGKGTGSAVSISPAKPANAVVPAGGLIVTDNGRVVYRSSVSSNAAKAERPLVHRVEPEYPSDAKAQQVQGSVVLDVQVLNTGAVGTIAVVSGDPLLTQAAVDAVKQWRYQPDTTSGQGAASQTRVTIKFTLPPA